MSPRKRRHKPSAEDQAALVTIRSWNEQCDRADSARGRTQKDIGRTETLAYLRRKGRKL